jgi:small redox-active disulfide protein 2
VLNIKVVGSGCASCEKLASLCNDVVSEKNLDAEIIKVTDLNSFADLGVFITPGLIVNDNVLSQGKIPTKSTF